MSSRNYSGHTSKVIDDEIKAIVDGCYTEATRLLEENRDILEAMKDALIEFETIDSEQVGDLMARRKMRPPRDWQDSDFNSHLKGEKANTTKEEPKKSGPIGGPAEER